MKNKKSKVSFDRNELEQFLNNSGLVIKEDALNRIHGGEPTYDSQIYANFYSNANLYSQSTFVNNIYMQRG